MLILWATQYKMPGEGPELLARAIALRLRNRGESDVRVESITGIGDLPVLEVADAAEKKSADLVILSTQGRKGIARLLHPSFTEALIRECSVPILVMGPRCGRVRELGDSPIQLFRTDFEQKDSKRLRRLTTDSKRLGFRLAIHHSIRRPIEPWLQTGSYLFSGAAPELHPYTSEELLRVERHGQAWTRWVVHQGVECSWELDDSPGSSNQHLIDAARRLHASSIWVAKNLSFGAWEQMRELTREAPCPVGFLP